jgi:hypothetical protein
LHELAIITFFKTLLRNEERERKKREERERKTEEKRERKKKKCTLFC